MRCMELVLIDMSKLIKLDNFEFERQVKLEKNTLALCS